MELTVLGSSSKGNCYILQNKDEALVIEAGLPLLEVKKAVDFNITKIVGVLVSHEHLDHAGHVKEFLDARIQVWLSEGTDKAIRSKIKSNYLPLLLECGCKSHIGKFTVLPFEVKHDCAEPMGFLIHHPQTGNILFVTDSYYIPYTFEGLNQIMIECNYRQDILESNISSGRIPKALRDRTLQSHMSYHTCLEALQANDLSKVNNIVLLHLSDGNSNEKEFREGIHAATAKNVHIAQKGLKINFNKQPF